MVPLQVPTFFTRWMHIKVFIEIILRYISYFLYRDGAEIVHCNGNYGHNYPFEYEYEPYIGGTRILWNFMKNHKRNQR